MKVDLLKNLIKEAVREVLVEELQLSKKQMQSNSVKENRTVQAPSISLNGNPLQDALMATRQELSSIDYSNFMISEHSTDTVMPVTDTRAGLDLSGLDFVKKATSIYKLSKEKDSLK